MLTTIINNKMGKSLGNYIGINEPAIDIVNKTMKIGDELIDGVRGHVWWWYNTCNGTGELSAARMSASAGVIVGILKNTVLHTLVCLVSLMKTLWQR